MNATQLVITITMLHDQLIKSCTCCCVIKVLYSIVKHADFNLIVRSIYCVVEQDTLSTF